MREVSGSSGPSSGAARGVVGEQHLAVRRAVVRHRAADPLVVPRKCGPRPGRRARRRRAPGTPRLIVSPVASAARPWAAGELGQVAPDEPALAKRSSTGPARKRPRSACCSTRPCARARSRSRDAVLFGSPASGGQLGQAARALGREQEREQLGGAVDRQPVVSRGRLELLFHAGYIRSRPKTRQGPGGSMFVNTMPRYEILSEDAMDVSTAAGDGSSPSSASSSAAGGRRAVPRGRPEGGGREGLSSTRSSCSSRWRSRRASSSCRRATRRSASTSAATTWCSRASTARRSCARAPCGGDAKMADFENFVKLVAVVRRAGLPGGTIVSPRTRRWTRATSTWSTRSRRCRTSRTWAR